MKLRRVYKQDGRYYYVQDLAERNPRTGRPRQKWHPLTRVDEGEAALHQALAALLGEPQKRQGNMPVLVKAFLKEHLKGLTLGVADEYERMFDVIEKAFEQFDVGQVKPGTVRAFLLGNFGDKPTARHHYKARLSTFFSWCVLNDHLQVNPCRELRLKAPPKRKGQMTAERFWRIWDKLTPMGRCFLELLFLTRQRPTEIRLLRESAIGDTHIHFVPTKTEDSSGEEVYILRTPEINAVLERARALRPPSGTVVPLQRRRDPFIIQTRDGDGYTKNGLYEVWRDAVNAAGEDCRGVTTRDVRPFALKAMEDAGYDLKQIKLSAAHALTATTEGYLNQHRDRVSDARIALPPRMDR